MLAYGLLALGLSSALALVTWSVVSDYLTQQRESSAIVETADNAAALHYGLFGAPQPCHPARERAECGSPTPNPNVSVMDLLNTLPSTDSAASMVYYNDQWYSLTGKPADLPSDLIANVRAGSTQHRRISVNGQQVLAVGVPMTRPGEAFFEWHPLDNLDSTLRTLKITLVAAALVTAMIGLAVGRLASTLALRPLAELTRVADAVARGKLDARLQAENDRDLGGLARSFNQTAADLERRVAVDARFAGDVSHELRTPLMTMLNSMQLIQNHRAELPAAVREPVELLGYDLDRFRRLVIDLLEISRDDGGDQGSREIVRIADLVRAAADATAGREVTTVEPEAEGLTLQADKRRLERVIAEPGRERRGPRGWLQGRRSGGRRSRRHHHRRRRRPRDRGRGPHPDLRTLRPRRNLRPRPRRRPGPGHRRPPRPMARRHHPGQLTAPAAAPASSSSSPRKSADGSSASGYRGGMATCLCV